MLRAEEFRVIAGFERYQVGNWGSVFSTIRATRFLKWTIDDQPGYPYVQLMEDGASESTSFYVHELVARAFIPNPSNLPTVNHINGIKHDPYWLNLEWATQSDQQEHALSTGLNKSFGETHYAATLTWDDVDQIRSMVAGGIMQKDVAEMFGQTRTNICRIVNGRAWGRRP
jgi:NUMOD4 motif